MKKFFFFVTIFLVISSSAIAADFWHFGIGLRAVGVIPEPQQYNNAVGGGLLMTFGNPDSRFTTQIELDKWTVNYKRSAFPDTVFGITGDSTSMQIRPSKFKHSGLTFGFYEKFRAIEFSPALSAYIIGGFGGYFINAKYESSQAPFAGTVMRSRGYFSVLSGGGGLGLNAKVNSHFDSFVEGRYIGLFKKEPGYDSPNYIHMYFGVRYVF